MKFLDWFQQYNKAWVGILMIGVYLLNRHYGWQLPIDDDLAMAILGMLVSAVTYAVPNKPLPAPVSDPVVEAPTPTDTTTSS